VKTRPILCVAAALSGLVALPLVRSADAPDVPPGVPSSRWVPMSDTVGFVVQQERPAIAGSREAALQGFFLVKRNGSWWTLEVTQGNPARALTAMH
jgi:hypothetical protein